MERSAFTYLQVAANYFVDLLYRITADPFKQPNNDFPFPNPPASHHMIPQIKPHKNTS